MKITTKGQVTIPLLIRERAGLHPHSEVEFEVLSNGDVLLRPLAKPAQSVREAFQRARGSANAAEFKGMSTDDFMAFLRS
jgi:antitoxin PrlF